MITYLNDQHALHHGKMEMFRGELVPCFEIPARLDHVLNEVMARKLGAIETPPAFDDKAITRVHAQRYVDFLTGAWDEWVALDPSNAQRDAIPSYWPIRTFRSDVLPASFPARMGLFSYDAGSPLTSGTWTAARAGANCALAAAQALTQGQRAAFALTRPPGHHAGADFFGGYCFLNNAAIAAQALRDAGMERVAVLDIDFHHGNGTQAIFYGRSDVLFASIHGDPRTEYPFYLGHADETGEGEGAGFNLNLPLPAGTGSPAWFEALEVACRRIERHRADALVVSLGLDTFAGDPISKFSLATEDYSRLGARLKQLGLPTAFILEGGYAAAELGVNAANVLEGFAV
jgi:acetoin utilization deacetylase AcuC-like enzyme